MKRSWLIGAALLLSLSAVACSDDSDDATTTSPDGSVHGDAGPVAPHVDGGMDAGGGNLDGGNLDATVPVGGDAGDAGDAN